MGLRRRLIDSMFQLLQRLAGKLMPNGRPGKNPFFTNPFFMVFLGASVAFVVSALAYLVSSYAIQKGAPGSASRLLGEWLDAWGPVLLSVEFALMVVAAITAMVTDDLFSASTGSGESAPQ